MLLLNNEVFEDFINDKKIKSWLSYLALKSKLFTNEN